MRWNIRNGRMVGGDWDPGAQLLLKAWTLSSKLASVFEAFEAMAIWELLKTNDEVCKDNVYASAETTGGRGIGIARGTPAPLRCCGRGFQFKFLRRSPVDVV